MPLVIRRFTGEHAFLSNFFIEPDGTTVEHEFQADKTEDIGWKRRILSAAKEDGTPHPGKAKRLGRKAPMRDDWDDIKIGRMTFWVRKKFTDHDELGERLLDTGRAILIEGNEWHDIFWGRCDGTCRHQNHRGEWMGANMLGRILMQTRRQLGGQ